MIQEKENGTHVNVVKVLYLIKRNKVLNNLNPGSIIKETQSYYERTKTKNNR